MDTSGTQRVKLRRQGPPGTSADQYVHDRVKDRPIVDARHPANPPPCGRTRADGSDGSAISHKPSGTIQPHRPTPPVRGATAN